MHKILITGALGFIGRTLIQTLLSTRKDIQVYGIDIKNMPLDDKLSGLIYSRLDCRDKESIDAYFKVEAFDGVIHLAAISRVVEAEKDKKNCIETNYGGTMNVIDAIKKYGKECWMIFASSREVYGEQTIFPVEEKSDLLPINVYGFYKLLAEQVIRENLRKYIILRFCNVYGNEYDIKDRVIPNFILKAIMDKPICVEGGGQIIDFTYIEDTIHSIICAMDALFNNTINHETIHISPGEGHSLLEIIGLLEKFLNKKLQVQYCSTRAYDVIHFVGNPHKRIRLLTNKPFTNIEEGVQNTLELYQKLLAKSI